METNNLHNLFKEQLETNSTTTEEMLGNLKNKNYYNGDPIQLGDKVLFGMLIESIEKAPEGSKLPDNISLRLVTLNEKHFELYEEAEMFSDLANSSTIPRIQLKKK